MVSAGCASLPAGLELVADRRGRAPPRAHRQPRRRDRCPAACGRLAHEAIRVCFLLERRYTPYAKWLGAAFGRLDCHAALGPLVERILVANGAKDRDDALVSLLEALARLQNAAGMAATQDASARQFFSRPYRVVDGGRFARALVDEIQGEDVRRLARRRLIGGIDQVSDSTDLLEDVSRRRALRALYE